MAGSDLEGKTEGGLERCQAVCDRFVPLGICPTYPPAHVCKSTYNVPGQRGSVAEVNL